MEQNNFEKHIQSGLDELKIPPSDAVWDHIEKRLTKNKKDRRIFLVFFLLFLLLLSGGYWLLEQGHPGGQHNPLSGEQHRRPGIKDDIPGGRAGTGRDSIGGKTDPGYNKKGSLSQTGSLQPSGTSLPSRPVQVRPVAGRAGKKITDHPGIPSSPSSRVQSGHDPKGHSDEGAVAWHSPANPPGDTADHTGEIKPAENTVSPAFHEMDSDSLRQIVEAPTGDKKEAGQSKTQIKGSRHRKERWTPGIFLSGGTSLLGKLPLGFNNRNLYAQANYPGTPPVYVVPSKMRNAAAFSAGILFEKNISSGNKVSLGLSYTYYSLEGKVGNEIDSAASLYYLALPASERIYSASGNVHTYHEQFHFVEIPISVQFQIGHNPRVPLCWLAGVDISQLISSNAVQFQPDPGIYYTDNRLLNKSQFGLHTGFSLTLLASKKNPLTVGPYLYYSVTRVADTGLYQGKNFSFIGLKATLLFPKK